MTLLTLLTTTGEQEQDILQALKDWNYLQLASIMNGLRNVGTADVLDVSTDTPLAIFPLRTFRVVCLIIVWEPSPSKKGGSRI